MIRKIQTLIEQMAHELPGILAAAVVAVDDGLSLFDDNSTGMAGRSQDVDQKI